MGADPYWYFVDYEPDLNVVLTRLREREFRAGRYYPAVGHLEFPLSPTTPSPGAQHRSIEAARKAASYNGTRSILDLERVGVSAHTGVARQLTEEELMRFFGTTEPAHSMIDQCMDIWEDLERGQGICIVVYSEGKPTEVYLAGYSYD